MLDSHSEDHFKSFAQTLEKTIAKYGDLSEETLIDRQRRQIETLVSLEKQFRKELIAHRWGVGVYRDFVKFICEEKRNILAARPFFRERQKIFTKFISKALKKREDKALYRFHFNYQFVLFALKAKKWHPGSPIRRLADEISAIRTEIIEMNMPLAINRSSIFWSRTPKAHLSYMDFVQISAEGMMSAVDKFVLPYSTVFRSVAIGRIVGNFIQDYSETVIHFYPVDKRKLYRANKIIRKYADSVDFEKLAAEVNEGVPKAHWTTAAELADLMSAASCVSSDEEQAQTGSASDRKAITLKDRFSGPESLQPDVIVEQADAIQALSEAYYTLDPIDIKVLKMKGISL